MKKIVKNKEIIKATKKFTDREQPRKVFWDEYSKMEANLKDLEDIFVISYYGVGGIGKSSLLRKLGMEMNEKNVAYILYDFETAQDYKTVLLFIKNQLEQKYNFEFPLFDIALYIYSKSIGDIYNKKDIESLTEKSRVISLITETLSAIPGTSIVASIFKSADLALAIFKNKKKENKNRSDLIKLQCENTEEILKNLPYYFSRDLANNLEEFKQPLVILLDTYEKLVNEIKSDGFTLMNDMWLRDEKGPILQVPGVLWVIAGREKLKWGDYDKDWEETLNQHILGDLSFQDADNFLQEAGIVEENLRKELYELTNGTPIYLDICVDTYQILKDNGETITIDKFGKNVDVLIERFIRYMDIQSSELTYMLSIIGNWTDDLIEKIGYKVLPNFSITLYENLKKLSFVFFESEKYYIHKTVRDICQMNSPKLIKEKTLKELLNYYWEKISETNPLNNEFLDYCIKYVDYMLLEVNEENIENKTENLSFIIEKLENSKNYYGANLILDKCYLFLKEKFPKNKKQFLLDTHKTILLVKNGFLKDIMELYEDAINNIVKYKYWSPILFQEIATSIYSLETRHYMDNICEKFYNFIDTYNVNTKTNENLSIIKNTKAILAQKFDNNLAMELAKNELENCKNDKDKITWLNKIIEILEENYEKYEDMKENYVTDSDISYYETCMERTEEECELYRKSLEHIIENNQITNNENEDLFSSYFILIQYYLNKKEFSKAKKYMDKIEFIFEKDNRVDLLNEYNIIFLKIELLTETKDKSIKDYSIEKIEYLKKKYAENFYTQDLNLMLSKYISQEKCDEYLEYLLKKYFMDKNYFVNLCKMFLYYIDDGNSVKKAIKMYKKVFDEYIELHGELTKEILNSLNDFAGTFGSRVYYGKYKQCQIEMYIMSYNEHIKIYGENDPKTLDVLGNIADFYRSIYEYKKAKKIYEKIYNGYIKTYGENDSKTLDELKNIANFYCSIDEYKEAEKIYEKIYNEYVKIYDENSDPVLDILNTIAFRTNNYRNSSKFNYSNEDDLKIILKAYQIVYDAYARIYGENHQETLEILERIASLCRDDKKSLEFYEKIYDEYVKIYGEYDEKTIYLEEKLADAYYEVKNYEKACYFYQKNYEGYVKIYGKNAGETVLKLEHMARSFRYMKKYEKALEMYQEVYKQYIKMKKNKYFLKRVQRSISDIANDYYEMNDYEKALEIYKNVYNEYVKLSDNNDVRIEIISSKIDKLKEILKNSQ